jgi:hypothetical protein
MRVDIFQAAAIACRGNAFLQGEFGDRVPELTGPTDLFRHVQELSFHREGGLPVQNGCLALGTKSFFLRLKREGADEFRLALDLCRRGPVAAEVQGWGIVATSDQGTELWQPVWKGILVRYNEASAYRVGYHSAKHSPWAMRRPEVPDSVLARLRSLMHETLQVCIDLNFAPLFDKVRLAWSHEGTGAKIAEEIVGKEARDVPRELAQMAVQCVLLVEGADWKRALDECGDNSPLAHVTDRLWSASMRALESLAVAPVSCWTQR